MAGRHPKRERKVSKCTRWVSSVHHTHASHLPTQPSHALPTKPIAQPYLLAATKEARHGREACCGRHNPEEKGRLAMGGAFLCTMPVTSYPHATLACIVEKRHLSNRTH